MFMVAVVILQREESWREEPDMLRQSQKYVKLRRFGQRDESR